MNASIDIPFQSEQQQPTRTDNAAINFSKFFNDLIQLHLKKMELLIK